ncbi:MAG TPA: hypothetical protein VFJ02_07475 [Vicinamibacterales bacterium]|nr:hypothetical protein [Vicinamibacterales bacterium]
MRGRLLLAFVTALAAHNPAPGPQGQGGAAAAITLEVRVFNGTEEVTPNTRLTVHRAGERQESIPHTPSADARVQLKVPPGIYDVQAIHERDGRVINIRWANRLVVMPYPDEEGHHLEVINFKNGYGALQVRAAGGAAVSLAIFEAGKRQKPAGVAVSGENYSLFVVPAGIYDLQVRSGAKLSWQNGIEVPLDGTRLSIVQ